jgi:hypothetical protein
MCSDFFFILFHSNFIYVDLCLLHYREWIGLIRRKPCPHTVCSSSSPSHTGNTYTHTYTCADIVLYCIVLYCIVLYCIVLYCIVLYWIVLYCIVLYCIVLYCIVLYCIVLYFIVLYCIILH